MSSKYDTFWKANDLAGGLVEAIDSYKVGSYTFGRYGKFTVESADICVMISKLEGIAPEVDAVTWMNETTFRNYSESNPNAKNNPKDDFELYDVGPRQINVGMLRANLAVNYISIKGLDINKILGTKAPIFNGDPIENARCAARLLKRMGSAVIIGEKDGQRYQMFESIPWTSWQSVPDEIRNRRRVVAYTGPAARPGRLETWNKLSSMFKKFFEEYQK
jgi:hypothetical protein